MDPQTTQQSVQGWWTSWLFSCGFFFADNKSGFEFWLVILEFGMVVASDLLLFEWKNPPSWIAYMDLKESSLHSKLCFLNNQTTYPELPVHWQLIQETGWSIDTFQKLGTGGSLILIVFKNHYNPRLQLIIISNNHGQSSKTWEVDVKNDKQMKHKVC